MFDFVDVVPGCVNVMSVRWVFPRKVDKDDNLVKPKARLIARGFSQAYNFDLMETYTLTPAVPSDKLVLQ